MLILLRVLTRRGPGGPIGELSATDPTGSGVLVPMARLQEVATHGLLAQLLGRGTARVCVLLDAIRTYVITWSLAWFAGGPMAIDQTDPFSKTTSPSGEALFLQLRGDHLWNNDAS